MSQCWQVLFEYCFYAVCLFHLLDENAKMRDQREHRNEVQTCHEPKWQFGLEIWPAFHQVPKWFVDKVDQALFQRQ